MGRPKLDRYAAFDAICKLPRAGRHLKNVSVVKLAVEFGCDRGTDAAMLRAVAHGAKLVRLDTNSASPKRSQCTDPRDTGKSTRSTTSATRTTGSRKNSRPTVAQGSYRESCVDTSHDDDVLEPLPVYEDGVPVPPAPVGAQRRLAHLLRPRREPAAASATLPLPVAIRREWDWSISEELRPVVEGQTFSATFTRLTELHPALLADLPNWWRRRADDARVRVTRQLVLEAPRFESSGTWRLRGSLRSPWLRRRIPVELQLWPRLGSWTKVSLEPQRRVRLGRRYFDNGHRALDTLTTRLHTELRARH
jgi:hypothetical protein